MARFGSEPGDRGTLDIQIADGGVVRGLFLPKVIPRAGSQAAGRLDAGVKLFETDPAAARLRIYPTDTRSWSDDFLGPKYAKITTIIIPIDDVDADWDALDGLENLPSGFTKDPEYGLGLARECEVFIDLIEESTDCETLEFVESGDPSVVDHTFRISFARFDSLRAEFGRIKVRGDLGIRRVKETYVHNNLAEVLGLEPRKLSLGRLPTSKWITKVAAGEAPLNDGEQDELLSAATASAAQIAATNPQKLVRFQGSIQLANLNQLIDEFEIALDESHHEDWWQAFFELNVFVLQLIFGGPTMFVDSQVPIGSGTSVKGRKIADYLFKNALTDNAALVEIKKPHTQLLGKHPYREGVYGVYAEIAKSVTQVLDQSLQLSRTEAETKTRTRDTSWSISAPRCFVVAGRASELDTPDKRKSFELYREHLAGVRLVTYDEILEQLRSLQGFLAVETSE